MNKITISLVCLVFGFSVGSLTESLKWQKILQTHIAASEKLIKYDAELKEQSSRLMESQEQLKKADEQLKQSCSSLVVKSNKLVRELNKRTSGLMDFTSFVECHTLTCNN